VPPSSTLPPLHPASIRDSVSFEAHVEGARKSQEGATDPVPARWYEAPCFYFTNPHACVGAFDDVERFPGSELFDLELEVGVVYRAYGKILTPLDAAPDIVGYTIFNDWSARDLQRLEGQLPSGFFKGKDGAHTLGPYPVTADELETHRTTDGFLDLTMRARINGELLGEDSLANMAFTFEELISFASRGRRPWRSARVRHLPARLPHRDLGPGRRARAAAAGARRRGHPGGRGPRDGPQPRRRPGPADPAGPHGPAPRPAPLRAAAVTA
jgi:2-keto-4-pentenoate hydratase/2-oxohepta-3-ene-1,7-dioic acid hydratase in catechol pathway